MSGGQIDDVHAEQIRAQYALSQRYRVLHYIFAWIHFVTCIALVGMVLGGEFDYSAELYFIRQDRREALPRLHSVISAQVEWIIVWPPLISSLGHLCVAVSKDPITMAPIARYIDYGLSSSLMILVVAILSGLCDIVQLVYIVFAQCFVCYLGVLTANAKERTSALAATLLSCVLHFLIWATIIIFLVVAIGDALIWVYLIVGGLGVAFSSFPVVEMLRASSLISVHQADLGFLVLSATAKNLLQWTLVGGINSAKEEPTDEPRALRSTVIASGAVCVLCVFLTITVMRVAKKYDTRSKKE